jgi:hypothetical protein
MIHVAKADNNECIEHENAFPGGELLLIRRELGSMLVRLDTTRHASRDQPDGPYLQVVSTTRTGKRGRPRKEINRDWLARMHGIRGVSGLASLLDTSSRTVRRRLVDYELVEPGVSPIQRHILDDGTIEIVYNSEPPERPRLSEAEVDSMVASHLEIFPNFGRTMLAGALRSRGQRITRREVRASYDRLQGGPTQTFADRRIHRRAYHVAGPNSLWHHDGQHGMCFLKKNTLHHVTTLTHYRTHSLQVCHSCVYRWILSVCGRNTSG